MQTNYSLLLRVWHWLNVVAILGLIGTFFLRKTFLSWRDNSALIIEKLASYGIEVSAQQAKEVAQAIRAPMWEWHIIFGIMLSLLLLMRLFIIWKERGFGYDHNESVHIHFVHNGYKVLYGVLLFMSLSGLFLIGYESLGVSKDFAHSIKEIHELIAWVVVIFVPLHIVGVVIAETKDQKGLVSKMISG